MDLYFQNETLYVKVHDLLNAKAMLLMKNKIFRLIDDYGIDKINMHFEKGYNFQLITNFKREYYRKYHGYLFIK